MMNARTEFKSPVAVIPFKLRYCTSPTPYTTYTSISPVSACLHDICRILRHVSFDSIPHGTSHVQFSPISPIFHAYFQFTPFLSYLLANVNVIILQTVLSQMVGHLSSGLLLQFRIKFFYRNLDLLMSHEPGCYHV